MINCYLFVVLSRSVSIRLCMSGLGQESAQPGRPNQVTVLYQRHAFLVMKRMNSSPVVCGSSPLNQDGKSMLCGYWAPIMILVFLVDCPCSISHIYE